jgi:hypothetical protein
VTPGRAIEPDDAAWDAWRPEEAHRRLAGLAVPWYVAAGWAIDLFLGGERREHEDLELAVPGARFAEVAAALGDLEPFVIGTPRHGLATPYPDVDDEAMAETHQTWFRDREADVWRLDVFREPSDGDTWVCRRDERLRMPYAELIERTPTGIPYGRPDVVLLYKAKHTREKDEADFAAALPHLGEPRRRWLRHALELVHPGHRWLAELG